MKVTFKHTLTIAYSRVFEVLSLMTALIDPEKQLSCYSLEPFETLRHKHLPFLEALKGSGLSEMAWLELTLGVSERQNIVRFFEIAETLPTHKVFCLWMGSEIDLKEAHEALTSVDAMSALFKSLGNKDVTKQHQSVLFDFKTHLASAKALALEIDRHPVFNEIIECALRAGEYDSLISSWQEGMKERHPLSFSQELMSKPFWNIADYEHYEFVPVYFISPYRMRLMDSKTMIYVHGLKRGNNEDLSTAEQLAEALKLLSDPNRLRILNMLYMKPMYGKEIADATGLTTATVSHHLEALRQKGLINLEKVKQIKYFSANLNQVRTVFRQLDGYLHRAPEI